MSTITKEWLQQKIAGMESARDEIPFGLDEDNSNTLAALRIALASLEAEPVAYIRSAHNPDGFCFADGIHPTHRHKRLPLSTLQDGCYWEVTPLYTSPSAPVSVPDAYIRDERGRMMLNGKPEPRIGYGGGWNACRAAMLQGADGTLTNEGTIPGGNSPVIPDSWVACSDRLPPEGYEPDGGAVCYLVWHKNECDCGPQYSISNVFFLRKHWEKNFTHWMPLPLPPKKAI